jgi:hypothetical protein
MGDDSGIVFSFMFLQPRTALLRKKHNDKMNLFYWDVRPIFLENLFTYYDELKLIFRSYQMRKILSLLNAMDVSTQNV